MADRDESVAKLEAFNKSIIDYIGQVRDIGVPAVRKSAQELNQVFQSSTNDVIGLKSTLDDGEDALEDADGDARDALKDLAKTADKIADSRLGKVETSMQSAGEDFVEEATSEADEVREAGTELDNDGFSEAESAIQEAESVLERTKDALSAAFSKLSSHVQEVGDRFAGVLVRAGETAAEAESEADGEKTTVESAGTEATDLLKQYAAAAPDVYEQLEEAVATYYEGRRETLIREGGAVVNGVGEALDSLAKVVSDEVKFSLDDPFQIVLDDVLAPAKTELDDWIETAFMTKGALGDFETFTDLVRSAKVTAANIATELNKGLE